MTGLLPESRRLVDLTAEAVGGRIVYANDEFFGEASNLLKPHPAVWREGEYNERGKWMDGWETRRRRTPGHDFCLIELGAPGTIRETVIETTHFRGNQPEAFALHGLTAPARSPGELLIRRDDWTELLPETRLEPDATHRFPLPDGPRVTHVRLTIVPDGGVARLQLRGVVLPDWAALTGSPDQLDVAGLVSGGVVLAVSDETFGEPQNLLLPEPSADMGQGWETCRRRGEGHDWVVIRLGTRSRIVCVRLETDHFKGNYPESASFDWCDLGAAAGAANPASGGAGPADALPQESDWRPLLARTPLKPHSTHQWISELEERGAATHIRLNIFPDGGVARLRIFGTPDPAV